MANRKAFEQAADPGLRARRGRIVIAGVGTLLWILVAVVAAAAGGCGDNQAGDGAGGHGDGDALFPKLPKVVGHIDVVQAHPDNPRYFRLLEITDDAGRRWSFHADGWAGVSAAHLKDHQIQGATVTVWYERRRDGSLYARFVSD